MSSYYEYTAECNGECLEYEDITSERHGVWDYNASEKVLINNGWYYDNNEGWLCPRCKPMIIAQKSKETQR